MMDVSVIGGSNRFTLDTVTYKPIIKSHRIRIILKLPSAAMSGLCFQTCKIVCYCYISTLLETSVDIVSLTVPAEMQLGPVPPGLPAVVPGVARLKSRHCPLLAVITLL